MMSVINQVFGSTNASMHCVLDHSFVLKLCCVCCGRRSAISRSRLVRNRAVNGASGKVK